MAATHKITVITEDKQQLSFECRSDEDVITAAVRQSIYLMSSCREGGCATCKSFCDEGDYKLMGCSVQALTPEEEEEGEVLLCRTFPESDMEVEVPYTYDRVSFAPPLLDFEAEVQGLEEIASNVMRLRLKKIPDEETGSAVKLDAGQYMNLTIPGTDISRSFSPASISNDGGELEFLIRILPEGLFSNYLRNGVEPSERLKVEGPQGSFMIKHNGLQPRYFIAGGTGLAPVLSMVRQMQDMEEPQETRIYFGVNTEPEVFCVDELRELEQAMDTLTVRTCVWHPEDSWQGEAGNVVDILRRDLEESGAKPDLYLCGPPPMVDAINTLAHELDLHKEYIHMEKFLPSGHHHQEKP